MTTLSHKNLTGTQIHEPKGADTAAINTSYVADGAGSGNWTVVGFSTGDVKATIKTTADTGWVMLDDGTLGNSSSGATTRANADTESLYTLLWTNVSDTYAAVSTGRGLTAAADFAANKTIALPKALGRVLASSGAGSGLTSRSLGETNGVENNTIAQANLPNLNLTVTIPAGQGSHTHGSADGGGFLENHAGLSTLALGGSQAYNVSDTAAATLPAMSGTAATGGSGTALSNMQPTLFVNYMIKL